LKDSVKDKINKVNAYAETYRDVMRWEPAICKMICSYICLITGRRPNLEKYADMKQLIIDNTDPFSFFRGEISPYIASIFTTVATPEKSFEKLDYTYKLLREKKFTGSEQLVCTALLLCYNVSMNDMEIVVEHYKELYKEFCVKHPMNTSIDNYLGHATIALADYTLDEIPVNMKILETELKATMGGGKVLQTLINSLFIVKGTPEENAKKSRQAYMTFKSSKFDFKWYGNVGMMALLNVIEDQEMTDIVYDVIEAARYAESLTNFSNLSMDVYDRITMIMAIVIYDYCEKEIEWFNALLDQSYYGNIVTILLLVLIAGLFAEEDLSRL